jgi:hypothetical protein
VLEGVILNESQSALQGVLRLDELIPRLSHSVRLEQEPQLKVMQESGGDVQVDECGVRLLLVLSLNSLLSILFEFLDQIVLALLLTRLEFMGTASVADKESVFHRLTHVQFHHFD